MTQYIFLQNQFFPIILVSIQNSLFRNYFRQQKRSNER